MKIGAVTVILFKGADKIVSAFPIIYIRFGQRLSIKTGRCYRLAEELSASQKGFCCMKLQNIQQYGEGTTL